MRHKDALGRSLDQHRPVREEQITMRRLEISLCETGRLVFASEYLGKIDHAGNRHGAINCFDGEAAEVPQRFKVGFMGDVTGMRADDELRAEILGMDPKIIELENKISVEQDAAARTKLETELATLNAAYNALVQDEQVKLAKSQTLERYIEKGKTWVDSLQNQAATQMVLINKLQTDTKQRVVLYDALTSSLKTAQQQDVAHRINEIGVKTDQEAQTAMAAIGAATNDKMADMLEAHEGHMVFARQILEQKAKADERFARRFAAIVEKHDKNAYGE